MDVAVVLIVFHVDVKNASTAVHTAFHAALNALNAPVKNAAIALHTVVAVALMPFQVEVKNDAIPFQMAMKKDRCASNRRWK